MSEAKQKEKAENTNRDERRGQILQRRHAAKGSGLIDMEFDFISGGSRGSLWAKKTSKEKHFFKRKTSKNQ